MLNEVLKFPDLQIVTEYVDCGERLIESHCSCFYSKFLLGKLLYFNGEYDTWYLDVLVFLFFIHQSLN